MALGKADGSIVINTKILEAGFDKGMTSIKNKLGGLGRFAGSTLGKTADTIDTKINGAMDRTADKVKRIGTLVASAFAIGKLIGFAKEAIELGSDLAEVENVTSTVFPNMARDVDEWANSALDAYGLTRTMAKNYVGTFGAMSKAFGFSERKAYEMSTALAGLSGDAASFYNLSQDEAFTKLKSIFTGETESLKSLGVVMTQAALDQYALANGFGRTTANMTEQEKVSLRLAFVTDKLGAAAGDFTKTQDSWANQTKILSARFTELKTAIGQGLINLFTPIIKGINTLLSYLYTAAEAFNTFTATLMGKSRSGGGGVVSSGGGGGVAQAAADTAQAIGDVADNTAGAADATDDYTTSAKKAQKAVKGYLSTLDEVNKFTSDIADDVADSGSPKSGKGTNGGGGNGSGAGSPAGGLESIYDPSNFAVDEAAEPLSEFAQKLRDAFLAGDWEGLGKIIGHKINEVMAKIKEAISWDNVGPAITKFIDAFTRTFNSLIAAIDWHLIGETIATGVNTIVYSLNLLITGIKWNLLGMSFAQGVNGIIGELDWDALGTLLGERFMISWDMFLGFVYTLKWDKLGTGIQTTILAALDHIDTDEIYLAMSGFGIGLADFLNNLISPDLFGEVAGKVSEGLNAELAFLDEFGTHFDFDNFGSSIGEAINRVFIEFDFEKLGKVLAVFAKGLLRALNKAAEKISWKNVGTKIADGINTFFSEFQFTELSQTANLFLSSILDGLISLGSEIHWKDIGTNIGNGLRDFLWNFDPEAKIGTAIRVFVNGLFAALSKFFLKVNFGSLLEIVKTKLETVLSEVNFGEIGSSIIEAIWIGLTGVSMDPETKKNVLSSFSDLEASLSNLTSFTFDALIGFYNNFLEPIGTWVLGTGLPALAQIVSETLDGINWGDLKDGLDVLWKGLSSFTKGIGEGLIDFVNAISPIAKFLLNGLAAGLKALFGETDGKDSNTIESIGSALGTLLGGITAAKLTSTLVSNFKNLSGHVIDLFAGIAKHPYLAIAGAVFLITKALIDMDSRIETEFAEKIQGISNAIKDLNSQVMTATNEADYMKVSAEVDKFLELNEKLKNGGLSPSEQTAFNKYKDDIIAFAPEIKDSFDSLTGSYEGNEEALRKLIETSAEYQKQKALEKAWEGYSEQYNDAMIQRELAIQRFRNELQKLQDEGEIGAFSTEAIEQYIQVLLYGEGAVQNYASDYGALSTAIANNGDLLLGYTLDWQDFTTLMDEAQEGMNLCSQVLDNMSQAEANAGEEAQESAEKIEGATEKIEETTESKLSEAQKAYKSYKDAVSEGIDFEEWINQAGQTIDDMHGIWVNGEQVFGGDAIRLYEAMMNEFEGWDGSAIDLGNGFVVSLGAGMEDAFGVLPEAVSTIQTATEDELDEWEYGFSEYGGEYAQALADGLAQDQGIVKKAAEDLATETNKTLDAGLGVNDGKPEAPAKNRGSAVIQGTIDGAGSKEPWLKKALKSIIKGGTDAVDEQLGIENGISTVTEESGKATVEGISEGSEDKKSGLLKIFEELPDEMMGMMGDLLEEFRFPGRIIISGIRRGILNNKQALFDDIANLIPKMSGQLASLNSIMWSIGHNAAQSLANGFRSVHIPAPYFNVGTRFATAAGTMFPIPNVAVTWMANGGVIPRNASRFLAGLGDNNHETEVVSPLSTIRQAVNEALLEAGVIGNNGGNSKPLKIQIDGRTVFDAVINEAKSRQDRTGYNPFDL